MPNIIKGALFIFFGGHTFGIDNGFPMIEAIERTDREAPTSVGGLYFIIINYLDTPKKIKLGTKAILCSHFFLKKTVFIVYKN